MKNKFKRIFVIVTDSMGIGEAKDAKTIMMQEQTLLDILQISAKNLIFLL